MWSESSSGRFRVVCEGCEVPVVVRQRISRTHEVTHYTDYTRISMVFMLVGRSEARGHNGFRVDGTTAYRCVLEGGPSKPPTLGSVRSTLNPLKMKRPTYKTDTSVLRLCSTSRCPKAPPTQPAEVGDSPLPGCGGYANAYGAASATGHGEAPTRRERESLEGRFRIELVHISS